MPVFKLFRVSVMLTQTCWCVSAVSAVRGVAVVSVKLAIAKRPHFCQMKKICNKEVSSRHKARHG